MTLSPLRYHYQNRAEIEVIVQASDRDAAFDTPTASIGTALAADRTLGGLCDWVEAAIPHDVCSFAVGRTLRYGEGTCGGQVTCCGPSAGVDAPTWRRVDWMLWGPGAIIVISYLAGFVLPHDAPLGFGVFTHGVQEIMNLMWWGILVGMLAVGLIDREPCQFVIGVTGRDQGATSLVRAVQAGVLLDLCNHGVLMVGAKLYERPRRRATRSPS